LGTEIRCKKCSKILAEFDDVPNNVIWYSQFRHKIGGSCPKCGHKLPSPSKHSEKMRIEVKSSIPIVVK
jgi:phage FluMu protein Com